MNPYTKSEDSILYSCGDIFDKKCREKEKQINTGKNKQEKAGSQSHRTIIIINLHTKYEYSSLHNFREIFDENFIIQSLERKKIGQIQGKLAGEGWFAIPRYNKSLSTCTPNMNTLACTVSQKSLTKNFIIQSMERKKIEQIQGRISKRRLVRNPTV